MNVLLLRAVKIHIPAEFGQKQQLAGLQQYLNQIKIFHCRVYATRPKGLRLRLNAQGHLVV